VGEVRFRNVVERHVTDRLGVGVHRLPGGASERWSGPQRQWESDLIMTDVPTPKDEALIEHVVCQHYEHRAVNGGLTCQSTKAEATTLWMSSSSHTSPPPSCDGGAATQSCRMLTSNHRFSNFAFAHACHPGYPNKVSRASTHLCEGRMKKKVAKCRHGLVLSESRVHLCVPRLAEKVLPLLKVERSDFVRKGATCAFTSWKVPSKVRCEGRPHIFAAPTVGRRPTTRTDKREAAADQC
jgi:hypothetical protein